MSGFISTNCSKDKDASLSSLWIAFLKPAFSKTCPTNELEVCAVYSSFFGDTVNTSSSDTLSFALSLTSDNTFSASSILAFATSSLPTISAIVSKFSMYSSYEESILSNTIVGAILFKSSYISLCLLVSAIIKI